MALHYNKKGIISSKFYIHTSACYLDKSIALFLQIRKNLYIIFFFFMTQKYQKKLLTKKNKIKKNLIETYFV